MSNAPAKLILPSPRLLIVMAPGDRADKVRAQVDRQLPDARVDVLDNVLDAIMQSARWAPDLMLLDFAIDGAAAPALITNLARVSPRTEVLVFDELVGADSAPRSGAVRPWDGLSAALKSWLERRNSSPGAGAR